MTWGGFFSLLSAVLCALALSAAGAPFWAAMAIFLILVNVWFAAEYLAERISKETRQRSL